MRITKILRSLAFMKVILGVISRSFQTYIYVFLLLILFLIIFSLLGLELYKGKFDDFKDEMKLRTTFNTF